MKKTWMIEEFDTMHPGKIIIAQPANAYIIQRRTYNIADMIRYDIMFIEECPTRPLTISRHVSFMKKKYRVSEQLLKHPEKEECSIVNILPAEILINIFERLDMNDFFAVVQVCKRFREIALASQISGKLSVDTSSMPIWKLEKYLSSFGSRVKNVEIMNSFSLRIPFKIIVQYCQNIRELSFQISNFADCPDVSELIELISGVEKLHLVSHRFSHELLSPNCKFTSLNLQSCRAAPAYHFTHLTELGLFICKHTRDETQNHYNILCANPQIRKLTVKWSCLDFGAMPRFTNLEQLTIKSYSINDVDKFNQFATNVKTLTINHMAPTHVVNLLCTIHENNLPIEYLHLNVFNDSQILRCIKKLTNVKFVTYNTKNIMLRKKT